MKYGVHLVLLIMIGTACSTKEAPENNLSAKADFQHEIITKGTPWNSENFNTDNTFSFAVISDLNGGEREGIFEQAVSRINLIKPDFVLSVGDLIEGGTEDKEQLAKEFDSFDQRASKLRSPFFVVGGNHDLTNPIMRQFWVDRYGARYYYFIYNNVLFLQMDSEDYDESRMQEIYEARAKAIDIIDGKVEGTYEDTDYYKMDERKHGQMRDEQLDYFVSVVKNHPGVDWTFVLMHKPVWMKQPSEFEKLEAVLTPGKYTLLNGHFHSYSHRIKNNSDYIILGTTGGSQTPTDSSAFDHFMYITMDKEGPSIINLKLEGIVDKTGR